MNEEDAESAQSDIDESRNDARDEIAELDQADDMEERLETNKEAAEEVEVPEEEA